MPSKYWIKLYHEVLDDPKMCRLTDRLYRRTMELFLLAGKTGDDGSLPDVADMAWYLRIDEDALAQDLQELSEVGIVTQDDEGWFVTKFADRQEAVSSTERVRRFRDRQKKGRYYCNDDKTKRYTEPEKNQIRIEPEAEPEAAATTSGDADTGAVYDAWKKANGAISPLQAELIGDMIDEFGSLVVLKAVKEAAGCTERFQPKYVRTILDRWKREGGGARASPETVPRLREVEPGISKGPVAWELSNGNGRK